MNSLQDNQYLKDFMLLSENLLSSLQSDAETVVSFQNCDWYQMYYNCVNNDHDQSLLQQQQNTYASLLTTIKQKHEIITQTTNCVQTAKKLVNFLQLLRKREINEYDVMLFALRRLFDIIKQKETQTKQESMILDQQQLQTQKQNMLTSINKENDVTKKQCLQQYHLSISKQAIYTKEQNLFMTTLQVWTRHSQCNLIYDSDKMSQSLDEFNSCVMNKPCLYFIVTTCCGYSFGAYLKRPITKTDKYTEDPSHFIFSFVSPKEINTPIKYDAKHDMNCGIKLYKRGNRLFHVGNRISGAFSIFKTTHCESYCVRLSDVYQGMEGDELTGTSIIDQKFCVDRVLVIQMYD
ncbi:TLDc domain-containing protein [Entamoeba marina]